MKAKKNTNIYLLFSLLLMIVSCFLPEMFGMSKLAVRALFFTIAILFLLVTETAHIGIIALLMIVLQPILGLTNSFVDSVMNFSSPIFFFLIAAFIIAGAVQESALSKRILKFLLLNFGKTTKGTIIAIFLATALLSTVIANLPALILFYGISLEFLSMFENAEERKQTGKSICIGLVYAALCGGVCTMVGNMNPMIAASTLTNAEIDVSFLQWMIIGVPVGVILFIIMIFIIFKIFPPVEISAEKREAFIESIHVEKKMSKQEKWVSSIIILMIVFWLLGSKFPMFNTMHVAICGATMMLLPCFDIMDWPTANKYIGWPAILLTCSFISIAAIFTATGLTDWILSLINTVLPAGAGTIVILIFLGIVSVLTMLLISNGPALITIFAPAIIGLASSRGINPAYLMIPLSMFMAFTVLLPLDPISLVTYASGCYEMKDELKAGIPFATAGIIIISVISTILMMILGF